ncbi:LOW QUALITY PROTEIN: hypothetical protein HJFPF1_05242 [Paramyrothecium foliicola]|nr:LOW QUALITY PROTEIN: hypothetical protein HJFPF1_05242 [Paramyrothecium foliicola]
MELTLTTLRSPERRWFAAGAPGHEAGLLTSTKSSHDSDVHEPGGNTSTSEAEAPVHIRYRVSSAHLCLASPVFDKMLNGPWMEGPGGNGAPRDVYASDWHPEAFVIVLDAIHGQHLAIPQNISLERLADVAAIVDYYDCQHTMVLLVKYWRRRLHWNLPEDYDKNCVFLMAIHWVFLGRTAFNQAAEVAFTRCRGPILRGDLPLPDVFLRAIEDKRKETLDKLYNLLGELFVKLSENHSTCMATTDFGSWIQVVHAKGTAQPRDPRVFHNRTIDGFEQSIDASDLNCDYCERHLQTLKSSIHSILYEAREAIKQIPFDYIWEQRKNERKTRQGELSAMRRIAGLLVFAGRLGLGLLRLLLSVAAGGSILRWLRFLRLNRLLVDALHIRGLNLLLVKEVAILVPVLNLLLLGQDLGLLGLGRTGDGSFALTVGRSLAQRDLLVILCDRHDRRTYAVVESVAVKVPGLEELHTLAFGLGPGAAVGKRSEQSKSSCRETEEGDSSDAVDCAALAAGHSAGDPGCEIVEELGERNDTKVQSGEVVMKEELALHQEEGKVVQSPAENRAANLIVEALHSSVGIIVAAALPADDGQSLKEDPDGNGGSGGVPHNRVTQEVDLHVVLAPEVDTTAEDGPRGRAGVPSVRVGETGVGPPHDRVELKELAKESRVVVVDLLGVLAQLGVLVVLDVPETVGQRATPSTGNFLLLGSPFGQLYLVREQNTACHEVNEPELGLNSTDSSLGNGATRLFLDNLNAEEIVGITLKALITVGGDLILPVSLTDGRADIVRMEAAVSGGVVEPKNSAVGNVDGFRKVVPGVGAIDGLAVAVQRLGLVLKNPNVVLVLVGVQGDLLLFAASGVHERVGVQVAALGVDVANGDTAAQNNIGGDILHALGVEGGLKLGAHEAISVTRVAEAHEVNRKHGHVESGGDNDEGECASHEVLGQKSLANCYFNAYHGDVLVVAEQNPQLDKGQAPDPGDGEKANPFDADSDSETKTSHEQPEPPAQRESLLGAKFVLVREGVKSKGGEGSSENQRRVEENQTSLGQKTILYTSQSLRNHIFQIEERTKDDEASTHSRGHGSAADRLQGEVHAGDDENTADGREQSHGDVGDARLEVVLSNVLEIEAAVETRQPTGEGDEHLGQRRMHIHEEFALDILGREATEARFWLAINERAHDWSFQETY